jgi:hypothetical protein
MRLSRSIARAIAARIPITVRRSILSLPRTPIIAWQRFIADAYLISFPKCGRTWLRLMIGRAIDAHYRVGSDNLLDLWALASHNPTIPKIVVTHEDDSVSKLPRELNRDKSRFATKRVVFLVRDPRDVVISHYFQLARREQRYRGGLEDFLHEPRGSLDSLIEYYNVWAESRDVPAGFLEVRYEDLVRDTQGELGRVLDFLGLEEIPEATIGEAVSFASFDRMRKMEIEDAFGSPRLRSPESTDPEALKTRRGKVHGFRDYLEPKDIDFLNRRIAERLSPSYADYVKPV